jgi:hypothetical protein
MRFYTRIYCLKAAGVVRLSFLDLNSKITPQRVVFFLVLINTVGSSSRGLNFLIKFKLWCMRVFQVSGVIEILLHV